MVVWLLPLLSSYFIIFRQDTMYVTAIVHACGSWTTSWYNLSRGKKKQKGKKGRSTVFAPKTIWRCTWARVLFQVHDLHFTTNNICVAARLANLPPESTSQQTTFV